MGVPLSEPIRTVTTKDQWAVVDGALYRPLTLRENARAMGFPDAWRWPEGATRGDVVKGLGNAVPPGLARAVLERAADLV
jgi:DNA (cytosine-5)-methyltransferase 1